MGFEPMTSASQRNARPTELLLGSCAPVKDSMNEIPYITYVLPLTFLYYESVSYLMHDVNNINTRLNILKFFQKLSVVHSYNTRSSTSGKFYVQSSRLGIQKRSFSRFDVKLWNEIPQRVRDLTTKAYKREIPGILF